jgi:hypothetical protein
MTFNGVKARIDDLGGKKQTKKSLQTGLAGLKMIKTHASQGVVI